MVGLRTCEVAEISGASYRQLDYWSRIGLLEPELRQAKGCGTRRVYSGRDAECARAIRLLSLAGLRFDRCRLVVSALRDCRSASFVVVTRSGVRAVDTAAEAVEAIAGRDALVLRVAA